MHRIKQKKRGTINYLFNSWAGWLWLLSLRRNLLAAFQTGQPWLAIRAKATAAGRVDNAREVAVTAHAAARARSAAGADAAA